MIGNPVYLLIFYSLIPVFVQLLCNGSILLYKLSLMRNILFLVVTKLSAQLKLQFFICPGSFRMLIQIISEIQFIMISNKTDMQMEDPCRDTICHIPLIQRDAMCSL